MKRDNYNTKQKELIINTITKLNKDFTVKDIYNELNNSVGLTTIYRVVDKLLNDEKIIKDNDKYRYLNSCEHNNHFYLKCEKCKRMIHIDCDCINDLSNHIKNNHKFLLKKEHIIINGLCELCKEV